MKKIQHKQTNKENSIVYVTYLNKRITAYYTSLTGQLSSFALSVSDMTLRYASLIQYA